MDFGDTLSKQSSLASGVHSTIYEKFFKAVRSGNDTLVLRLMPFLKFGVNVATIEKKMTPLMIAAAKGYLDTVEILLYNGADIALINAKDQTPLRLAIQGGWEKVVECLLNPLCFDKNKIFIYDSWALADAAEKGFTDILECLISNGFDVNAENCKSLD